MLANLTEEDWSWTPAQPGRIRSGTASVKPGGRLKLREGAVWVDPQYKAQHENLLASLLLSEFRRESAEQVLQILRGREGDMSASDIAALIPRDPRIADATALAAVRSSLTKLRREGLIASGSRRGRYVGFEPGSD